MMKEFPESRMARYMKTPTVRRPEGFMLKIKTVNTVVK